MKRVYRFVVDECCVVLVRALSLKAALNFLSSRLGKVAVRNLVSFHANNNSRKTDLGCDA